MDRGLEPRLPALRPGAGPVVGATLAQAGLQSPARELLTMKISGQRGQALPAVLGIMLLLVLLAGGASMAISAVLSQQRVNRNLTDADLSTQNAVAATAAHVANGSSCAPANPATPDSLLQDTFQSNSPPLTSRWSFPAGGWQVQQDQAGNPVLASTAAGLNVATPNGATYTGAGSSSNYRVTVGLRPMSNSTTVDLDAYYQRNGL